MGAMSGMGISEGTWGLCLYLKKWVKLYLRVKLF